MALSYIGEQVCCCDACAGLMGDIQFGRAAHVKMHVDNRGAPMGRIFAPALRPDRSCRHCAHYCQKPSPVHVLPPSFVMASTLSGLLEQEGRQSSR